MKLQQLFLLALLFVLQACGGSGGSGDDNNGGDTIEGRAIDGPLSGSSVFLDLNGNITKDDNEPSATSDSEGYFSISAASLGDTSTAKLVVIGGTDTFTNIEMDNLVLMSDMPSDLTQSVSVTPISSIIASVDTAEEKAAVLSALNIDKSVDEFLAMDPWQLAEQNDPVGQHIQQVNQKVAVMISSVQSMAANDADLIAVSKDVFSALAAEVEEQGQVDFTSSAMLEEVIKEALSDVADEVSTAAATSLVDINQLIENEADITSAEALEVVKSTQTEYQDLLTDLVHDDSQAVNLNESFIDSDSDGTVNLVDTDDDNDGVLDDHDHFPLDFTQSINPDEIPTIPVNFSLISPAAGYSFSGINCLLSKSGEDSCAIPTSGNKTQAVYVSSVTNSDSQKVVTISYVSDSAETTGLGLNVHFDSSKITFSASEILIKTDNITAPSLELVSSDADDLDSDASTDRRVIAAWASLYSKWPGSKATDLLRLTFDINDEVVTPINDDSAGNADGPNDTDNSGNAADSDNTGGSGDLDNSSDVVETIKGPANFIEAFGGASIQGDEFNFPSSAEPWAGIANMDLSLYPFNFADGGSISFTGAVPSGGSVNVQFKFEFKPSPDVDPSYTTAFETISGSTDQTYTIQIPSQGVKTFSNLILYIQERNTAVKIENLMVTTTTDPNGGNSGNGGNGGNGVDAPDDYNTLAYGAGSIGDTIYTSNHRCKNDYGQWVENAGVISTQSDVQALGCNQSTGIPTGNITKLYPQLTGPAAEKPAQTHKWWGSISFLGEMTVGDAGDSAYITPDPISARINNKGARVGSIPGGMRLIHGGQYYYPIPAHADEVFDGIAVGNSSYSNLEAYTKDYSEGSVTVVWKSGNTDVMEATFVHGSPYVYFKAYTGNLVLRTLRSNGSEKGTFYNQGNTLGLWTNVAGVANNFLVVGEGATTFSNTTGSEISVNNSAKELTLVYLPHSGAGSVSSAMISKFASLARNKVAAVNIDYAVNRSSNEITVTHSYVNDQGTAVDTFVGLHPLHWKNTSQATSAYQIRSARGTIKFAELSEFSYQIPYVGVLPTMPTINGSFDQATLEGLVTEFVNQGSNTWNTSSQGSLYEDTYWSGKNYGKAAELSAIARSIGMQDEADQLINWLKAELSDWFTAEADGELKAKKYFVYDSDWNTLLGFDEAYGSHQRLADHHFHYGYFVRAAAEICRVDLAWCGQDQYGPMIELLIRDYAADKDDPLFPHMRNFDPANGFSWADGKMNFIRGNNNESTSEAATAYGAIILYGMATGNTALTEKGMYLHASTGATFWEYWNNIDGYNNVSADADNFFPGYEHLTTSIIWGDGVDFATWFSGAYAHILGIQGLPSSPLIFHVGIHPEYMEDYVDLGLREASGGKPSGLVDDQWRDLWWNLWSMTDADAAIADYNTVSSYEPEQGESKAHTYHWIHTFKALGHLAMGTGELTSDHPAAIAFDKDGQRTYVVYNFTDQATTVTYSDGHTVNAAPLGFTID